MLCEIIQVERFIKLVRLKISSDRADSTAMLSDHAPHGALNAHRDNVKDTAKVCSVESGTVSQHARNNTIGARSYVILTILVREFNREIKCVGGAFRHWHLRALQ